MTIEYAEIRHVNGVRTILSFFPQPEIADPLEITKEKFGGEEFLIYIPAERDSAEMDAIAAMDKDTQEVVEQPPEIFKTRVIRHFNIVPKSVVEVKEIIEQRVEESRRNAMPHLEVELELMWRYITAILDRLAQLNEPGNPLSFVQIPPEDITAKDTFKVTRETLPMTGEDIGNFDPDPVV